jgi:tetratricopeptide (TPR) repeat protein
MMSGDGYALRLGRNAFELYQSGELEAAADKYAEAIASMSPDHYWSPQLHHEYAGVLSRLGRPDEALVQYQAYLEQELTQNPDESGAAAVVARYFLGEHLLSMGHHQEALDIIRPAAEAAPNHPIARVVEAAALAALGRSDEARSAAAAAVEHARSDSQRRRIRERLAGIMDAEE